jgi:hypothetical protein
VNVNSINRICFKCKDPKPLSDYNKNSKKSDGIATICKVCTRKYNNNRRVKKVRIWENWKPGYKVCGICKDELPFSEFHKAKLGLYGLKTNCKICEQKRNTAYRQKTGWENNYKRKRRAQDPIFKIRANLRGRLNDALRQHAYGKLSKRHSAIKLLECDIDFLMNYLEAKFQPGMSWRNYGSFWEIDHVIACGKFDLTDPGQQKQCFHYTNLQPLTVIQNRSKGVR